MNILAWIAVYDLSQSHFLEVSFFDVGQGDAIFFETPARRQVLVDGGPSAGILVKLAGEMNFWDSRIDVVILTHPDADHISGLVDVFRRYQVGLFVHPGISRPTAEYREILKIIQEKKIPALVVGQGSRIGFGDGVTADVLWPPQGLFFGASDSNRSSVVSKFNFGSKSFLLMADAEIREEPDIVVFAGTGVKADVLKVGHHGSKNASGANFLAAVQPDFSVISAGKNNRYGHPHPDVILRLEKIGSRILRTDLLGNVKMVTDGLTLKILSDRM